jgi:hypothetical protein
LSNVELRGTLVWVAKYTIRLEIVNSTKSIILKKHMLALWIKKSILLKSKSNTSKLIIYLSIISK